MSRPTPTTLSKQERATLRAVLQCWQNELGYYTTEELQDYYPDLQGHEPLSIEGVERLFAQLQVTPGTGATTVSAVSTVSTEGAS